MLRDEAITLAVHDILIAQAKNTHASLLLMNETGEATIIVTYLGLRTVIVTGFKTDAEANIYLRFKIRSNGGEHEQKLEIE